MRLVQSITSAVVSLLMSAGCSKSDKPTPATPEQVVVAPKTDRAPTESPPAKGEVLIATKLKPSDQPQTVALPNNVKLTIPGGLLKQETQLTVSAGKSPQPPVFKNLPVLTGFDISLGDMHRLEKPLQLEMPIEEKHLPKDAPAQGLLCPVFYEPTTRTWIEMPNQVDEKKRLLTVQVPHLSWVEVWHFGPHMFMPGQVLRIMTKDFWIYYNLADVQKNTTRYVARQASTEPTIPPFIADLRDLTYEALGAYRILDFRPPTEKLLILVTSDVEHSAFISLHGRIFISFQTLNATEMSYVIAHEMFHSIQARDYSTTQFWWWPVPGLGGPTGPTITGTQKWWMEASAEYAACRIALPSYREMGKQVGGNAQFLKLPLNTFGPPNDPDLALRYHQYQVVHFLDFLARRGVTQNPNDFPPTETFKIPAPSWADFPLEKEITLTPENWYFRRMYTSVAEGGGNALERLNQFLIARHGKERNLAASYRDFALFYLFQTSSPMQRAIAGRVNVFALEKRATPLKEPTETPTFQFSVPGPHAAKAWAVHRDLPPPEKEPRNINVILPRKELADDAAVYVCVLPKDELSFGPPEIAGTFIGSRDREEVVAVSLKPEDGLYVVAFNHGESTQQIEVQAIPAPIQIKSVDPPSGTRYTPVTIRGSGFGAQQPFNIKDGLFFHNKRVALIDSWSDTEIKAKSPDAPTGKFVVKLGSRASNPYPFTVDVPPFKPGWYELRVFFIYLRNMMPNAPALFLEVSPSGAVTVHARLGSKMDVIGKGTVTPNPKFTSNKDVYLWNVNYEYAFEDYPLVNDKRTKYVVTGKVLPFGVEGEVRGGGFTKKFQPSGGRAFDIGKPITPQTPLDAQLPNAKQPHDLIDSVRTVYNLEVTWSQNEEDIGYLTDLASDLEEQIKQVNDMKLAVGPPAAGDENALRARIKQLEAKLLPVAQELNKKIGLVEQTRTRGKELRTWNRQPPNLPYDRTKADLEAMYQALSKSLGEQRTKLDDLRKKVEELNAKHQKALSAKTMRQPTGPSEKARLQANITSLEAQIDLTLQRQPGRDKKLDGLTKSMQSLAPRAVPPVPGKGQGINYSVMMNLVPMNSPK